MRAGDKLFEFTSLKRLRASFKVPLDTASSWKKGMPVRFEPAQSGFPTLTGRIVLIGSRVSRVGQQVEVAALLENPNESIRAGQQGSLSVLATAGTTDPKQASMQPVDEVTVSQRKSKPVLEKAATVQLGDITAGQVQVTVKAKSSDESTGHVKLIEQKSLKLGQTAVFELGGIEYALRIKQLTNVLIGDDFAVVQILRSTGTSQTPGHGETTKVRFRLNNGMDAKTVVRLLTSTFEKDPQPPAFSVDANSGRLVCEGTKKHLQQVREILAKLGAVDMKAPGSEYDAGA